MSHYNPNSHKAYKGIKADGTLSQQQMAIYTLLSDGIARTSRQISKALDMGRASTTGRITAMKDKNMITVKENNLCPITHKTVEWCMT